jgi:transcription elongation GreA/GreB family factor
MDKSRLRDVILQKLGGELETITRAALMARDEATHEESKPENQYDMHAQEAAYLAEGQAKLAQELAESVQLFSTLPVQPWPADQPAGLGALVTLAAGSRRLYYLLGPRSGGLDAEFDGDSVTVITPGSPLGRQLFGARIGETVQLPGRGGSVPHLVVEIA